MKVAAMRRSFLITGVLTFALVLSVFGSASNAWSDYRQLREEINDFHAFIQRHPRVSTDLQQNPQLVYNGRYLDRHDQLKTFLKRHPLVRREIAENPRRVFGRYYRDQRHGPWAWR